MGPPGPVAQRIERQTSNLRAEVRLLPGPSTCASPQDTWTRCRCMNVPRRGSAVVALLRLAFAAYVVYAAAILLTSPADGLNQALTEWVYTGRVFPAAEALDGRLVSRVVEPDEIMAEQIGESQATRSKHMLRRHEHAQFVRAIGLEAEIGLGCRRDDADRLLRTVVETAGSGCRGDGIVFVTPVERAIKIRNAAEGAAALQS